MRSSWRRRRPPRSPGTRPGPLPGSRAPAWADRRSAAARRSRSRRMCPLRGRGRRQWLPGSCVRPQVPRPQVPQGETADVALAAGGMGGRKPQSRPRTDPQGRLVAQRPSVVLGVRLHHRDPGTGRPGNVSAAVRAIGGPICFIYTFLIRCRSACSCGVEQRVRVLRSGRDVPAAGGSTRTSGGLVGAVALPPGGDAWVDRDVLVLVSAAAAAPAGWPPPSGVPAEVLVLPASSKGVR
jgi:hypothetical protein